MAAADRGWNWPYGEAQDTWFDDFEERKDRIIAEGLPVYIRGFRIGDDGFVAMYVGATENVLPRRHMDRRFDLHFSLGKISDYETAGVPERVVQEVVRALNAKYAGRDYTIKIHKLGGGGSAIFHKDEPLIHDPLVKFLFDNGGVSHKGAHISL